MSRAVHHSPHTTSNVKRRRIVTSGRRTKKPESRTKAALRTKRVFNPDPEDNSQGEHGINRGPAQTELRMRREERDTNGEFGAATIRTRSRTRKDRGTRCALTGKELSFSAGVVKKWVPISEEAISVMMGALRRSSSVVGQRMESDAASRQMAAAAVRVRDELTKAVAPREDRQILLSSIKSNLIMNLESDLSSLVSENNHIEEMVLNQQRKLKDLQEKTQLLTRVSSSLMADASRKEMLVDLKNKNSKEWTLENQDKFCDHITNIISQERNISDLNY